MENLHSINGELLIRSNDQLTDISSISNIDAASIFDLFIDFNPSLSNCDAESICNYLAAPIGYLNIHDNLPGCNSVEEVQEDCDSQGINEFNKLQRLFIHPNPANEGIITIKLERSNSDLMILCFNNIGQQVHQQRITNAETVIDLNNWHTGIYLVVVYRDKIPVGWSKLVVLNQL